MELGTIGDAGQALALRGELTSLRERA